MAVRSGEEYDQSLVNTIIVLPMVVTGIVIIVQNSLALAFALAGIAGAVRFRNSLKSSGDALFILCAVAIGLSAGIGAVELAAVISIALNYTFAALWLTEYGERKGMIVGLVAPNNERLAIFVGQFTFQIDVKVARLAQLAAKPAQFFAQELIFDIGNGGLEEREGRPQAPHRDARLMQRVLLALGEDQRLVTSILFQASVQDRLEGLRDGHG